MAPGRVSHRPPLYDQGHGISVRPPSIRPALQADGGDIELKGVDEATGVVTVTLVGACGTCPASTQTLKDGIERIMRDRVDGVTEVVNV